MTNWAELEELARCLSDDSRRSLARHERERLELLEMIEASRPPLRKRVGAALVRLAIRLDPQALGESGLAADPGAEGRLALFTR